MAAQMAAQESRGDIADEKLASSRMNSVARMGFEPMTSSLKGIAASALC
jgi:hypothetical protein